MAVIVAVLAMDTEVLHCLGAPWWRGGEERRGGRGEGRSGVRGGEERGKEGRRGIGARGGVERLQ